LGNYIIGGQTVHEAYEKKKKDHGMKGRKKKKTDHETPL